MYLINPHACVLAVWTPLIRHVGAGCDAVLTASTPVAFLLLTAVRTRCPRASTATLLISPRVAAMLWSKYEIKLKIRFLRPIALCLKRSELLAITIADRCYWLRT